MTHASTARRAVRRAAQPAPPLGRDRGRRRPDRRPRGGARRRSGARARLTRPVLEPIDLEFLGFAPRDRRLRRRRRPTALPCSTAGRRRRCPRLREGLRERGLELADVRHLLPLAHPSRPCRRRRDDRARAPGAHGVGLRDRRAAPRRPVAPRGLGAPTLRRARSTRSGASSRPCPQRTSDRRGRRPRLGGVPDAGSRLAPRLLPPGRNPARRRRLRRPHPAGRRTCCRSRRRPTSTSRPGTRTIAEIGRRAPDRLALTHFGVATDVAGHLDRLGVGARPLGRARRATAPTSTSSSPSRSPRPAPTERSTTRSPRYDQSWQGLAPLLGQARYVAGRSATTS